MHNLLIGGWCRSLSMRPMLPCHTPFTCGCYSRRETGNSVITRNLSREDRGDHKTVNKIVETS